ncbi:MAG TPA: class I SAM-dependent methyltransferase [Pseudonocardia sp.]|nr:class I SAM-dependent methyltransferase [Pseudonocardia sp.]
MPMNLAHRALCSSRVWSTLVAKHLPGSLDGVDLGDNVLEIGPGFGATTRVLVDVVPRLTSIEIDEASVRGLRAEFGERVQVVHGDGTQLPFPDRSFSAVVCFAMLHHVPSPALQDRLFAEARRVLRPGGVFRGVDSRSSLGFRLLHLRDTMVVVDPATLPDRLTAAGLTDIEVATEPGQLTFLARAPAWGVSGGSMPGER